MTKTCFIVTIDGPSGAGKGTLAEKLSQRLGWPVTGVGAVMRRVVYDIKKLGINPDNPGELLRLFDTADLTSLSAPELQTEDVGRAAADFFVGDRLHIAFDFFRKLAERCDHLIIDGRIAGRLIFPDASIKFFITASDDVRAKRKMSALQKAGKAEGQSIESIKTAIAKRDISEYTQFGENTKPDGRTIVIDTSALSPEQVEYDVAAKINVVYPKHTQSTTTTRSSH